MTLIPIYISLSLPSRLTLPLLPPDPNLSKAFFVQVVYMSTAYWYMFPNGFKGIVHSTVDDVLEYLSSPSSGVAEILLLDLVAFSRV